jgi:hypothetical protein
MAPPPRVRQRRELLVRFLHHASGEKTARPGWFWISLTLFLATFPVFALGLAFALESRARTYGFLALVILTHGGLLTTLVLSSRIRHYVNPRGRWWRGDKIVLRNVSPIAIEKILIATGTVPLTQQPLVFP